jgi:CMP-N,N'-diacetyllegionaminic acid synthase
MYKGKKILALITARGGSRGIPGKNIKPLGGKPLINWTIAAAKGSKYIDRLIISTDDQVIADTAKEAGCEVPFLRPADLATDSSTSMDVIMHAFGHVQEQFDHLLLLQPTSPFRKTQHIDSIIQQGIDMASLMTVSVSKTKKHPAFMFNLAAGKLIPVLEDGLQKRRQDMPAVYEHNGALYFSEISYLKKIKSYNCEGVRAFVMGDIESLDIDNTIDWMYAECLLKEGVIN